jgi:hypothetical protein
MKGKSDVPGNRKLPAFVQVLLFSSTETKLHQFIEVVNDFVVTGW